MWRKEYLRLEKYTRVALLLNPNIATFWNTRKRLVSNQLLEINADFKLTELVLSQKPKCVEALAHRRWLLEQEPLEYPGWVETELSLCDKLSNRMKCNYHAWSHRQWVFTQAIKQQGFKLDLWASELETSDCWTKYHLSDHSGWHYRTFLLDQFRKNLSKVDENVDIVRNLLNDSTGTTLPSQLYLNLLNEELRKNEDLILGFNAHEALWYYRRFILQAGTLSHAESVFLEKCCTQSKKNGSTTPDGVQMRYLEHHRRWLSEFCI